jgi:enterobacterial common antigen flippase
MKSILRATAILSSSSVISVAAGLVSSKYLASAIGPAGIGYLAMLQAFAAISVMIAGMGMTTGIVRVIAKEIEEGNKKSVAAYQKAIVWGIFASGFIAALLIFLFNGFFNQTMLDGQATNYEVLLLGIGVIFVLLSNCFIAILNAFHKIKILAKISVANNLANTFALILSVWLFREKGLIFGIVVGSMSNLILSFYYYKKEIQITETITSFNETLESLKSLLKFGVPFTASLLVGTGVQYFIPLLILNQLDLENVGYFRAASAISVTSLSLVLNAMGQDYYPRLSAVSENKRLLINTINEQLHFILIIFSPVLLWLMLLSPQVILLLYSPQFSVASEILRIMLIGDIFKFVCWMLAFVLLARNKSGMYFLSELIFGVFTLTSTYFGIQHFGVKGVGVGYLISYFCCFFIVWFLVRREINLNFTRRNQVLLLSLLISVILIFALSNYLVGILPIYVAVLFCLAISFASIIYLIKQLKKERDV